MKIFLLYFLQLNLKMIIPVRCFTCGKVIANKWKKFETLLNNGKSRSNAFAEVGLSRYCCRRMFLGHIDLIDKLILYSKNNDKVSNKNFVIK